tara:strand:+ start:1739 stop:2212 length:474 start_codon:yes stop_codon:yes gene_type:complete
VAKGRNEEKDGKAVDAAAGSAWTLLGTDHGRDIRDAERAALRAAVEEEKIDRSVDRVTTGVGVVFEEDNDLGVFDFVGGKDTVFAVGLEQDDRGHEGPGEVPGVFLGEEKIVLHVRLHRWSGPIPLLMAPSVCGLADAITAQAKAKRPQLASGPFTG